MKAEEIKLHFQKLNKQKIELALVDDIAAELRKAFEANQSGANFAKQAVSQFNVAARFAAAAESSAKDGEERAKFLGVDSARFTSLKKEALDFLKLANQNVKKFS